MVLAYEWLQKRVPTLIKGGVKASQIKDSYVELTLQNKFTIYRPLDEKGKTAYGQNKLYDKNYWDAAGVLPLAQVATTQSTGMITDGDGVLYNDGYRLAGPYTQKDIHLSGARYHFDLAPKQHITGHTFEYFDMPDDVGGLVTGVKYFSQIALQVTTAAWIPPKFKGHWRLEFFNESNSHIMLIPGKVCAEVIFMQVGSGFNPLIGFRTNYRTDLLYNNH